MDRDVDKIGLLGDSTDDGRWESRKGTFLKTGHFMAGFLALCFLLIYGVRSYQFDFWQSYFFRDTVNLGANCSYAAQGSPVNVYPEGLALPVMQPIKLPHGFNVIGDQLKDAAFYHVRYVCEMSTETLGDIRGLPYLHVGWVFADRTEIRINGGKRLEFAGQDKPVVPLSQEDLTADKLIVDYRLSSKNLKRMGINGLAPMVIGKDATTNFRIFGLEMAMQRITVLYTILPLLTLGLVLIFGWTYGVRSRLIVSTFYYFSMALMASCFPLFSDFMPWDQSKTYLLSSPFRYTSWMAVLLFGMELMRWRSRLIPQLMSVITALCAVWVTAIIVMADPYKLVQPLLEVYRTASIVLGLGLVAVAWRKTRDPAGNKHLRRVDLSFGVLCGLFVVFQAAYAVIDLLHLSIYIRHYIELLMPLFVGGLLLYSLALIEKNYQDERTKRMTIERDLTLAHEIQDSLAPPPEYTHAAGMAIQTYQIKHSAVAGDWMAFREMPNGEHVVVMADATGKGVQAALIVHAVQSLWADVLHTTAFDPEDWIRRVNRTLYTLGQRKPHSMTLGIVVISAKQVRYFCQGHVPLFLIDKSNERSTVKPLIAQGNVLGLGPEVQVSPACYELLPGERLTMMLGTDGVFEKGSRTNRRQVLEVLDLVENQGTAGLVDLPEEDDKTLIIMRTNQPAENAA